MMERATSYRPDILEGRWRIDTKFGGQSWEVIVELILEKELLMVVTAYDVN